MNKIIIIEETSNKAALIKMKYPKATIINEKEALNNSIKNKIVIVEGGYANIFQSEEEFQSFIENNAIEILVIIEQDLQKNMDKIFSKYSNIIQVLK